MSDEFPNPAEIPSLSREEMARSIFLLCAAKVDEGKKKNFLTALNQRGESAEELAGFARELLKEAILPAIEHHKDHPLVELCGTGGDKAGLLNISTAAMFVVAGAGARVVKHGNRAVSSRCGSADVLEALGVNLHLDRHRVAEILNHSGAVFLLASDFHPAVAVIAPIRRALAANGQMTIFNLLGPLLNPAMPEYQLTGVYRREMLAKYAEAMQLLGRRRAWAVHGEGLDGGGIDELTITGPSLVFSTSDGKIQNFEIYPEDLGFSLVRSYENLRGGDAVENAKRIVEIISGEERSAARDMIVLNAAAALHIAGFGETLQDAVMLANESIDSGKALHALQKLCSCSH
jgi:anthranilate phosphoribosyltransferase